MSISIDQVTQYHETALLLRSKRSEIIASNIANANTPGYKARDIDFKEAMRIASSQQSSGLKTTHSAHYSSSEGTPPGTLKYVQPFQTGTGDGNTVDLPSQQVAFGQNALEYQMSLRFLSSKFKGMMTALKGE
ncbi:MAG: flagellar basal body rod protein FlgB [Enterobacterales bacterium]|nr:flagellar basal body rod protein FlgB [Enterobacterales bacterium]